MPDCYLRRWESKCFLFGLKLLALMLVVLCSAPVQAFGRRVVLAFANNEGLASDTPLLYAHKDAERFAQVMSEIGGVRERDVHLLLGATRQQVLAELRLLEERSNLNTTLVVFYSGHGSDGALHLAGEQLQLDDFEAALESVHTRLTLTFIDACRGGSKLKGFTHAPTFSISSWNQHKGHVVVQAAGPGEVVMESTSLKGGIFTHYLVSGLLGAADDDQNGSVRLAEAYHFAYNHTRSAMLERGVSVGGPSLKSDLAGQGPVVLTEPGKARSQLLLLPNKGAVEYYVVAKGGRIVAEARGSPGAPVRIALPYRGQFIVHQRVLGVLRRAEVSLPFGGVARVTQSEFVENPIPVEAAGKGHRGGLTGQSPFPHRLSLATTLVVDESEHWSAAPGASLSYTYGTSGWLPAFDAAVWRREYGDSTKQLISRTVVLVAAGVRHQRVLRRATLHAGAGLTAMLWRQNSFDPRRGASSVGRRSSTVGGVTSRVGVSLPVTGRLSTDLTLVGIASLYRQDKQAVREDSWKQLLGFTLEPAVLLSLGLTVGL